MNFTYYVAAWYMRVFLLVLAGPRSCFSTKRMIGRLAVQLRQTKSASSNRYLGKSVSLQEGPNHIQGDLGLIGWNHVSRVIAARVSKKN